MRSAATAARSSDSRNGVARVSAYGSKISAYSSQSSSRAASPVRSRSRSGSAPTSGSQLPGRMTSLLAPSFAPASRIWATSSSSSGTVSSPPSPLASAAAPSRKSRALRAIWSASGRQSSPGLAAVSCPSPALTGPVPCAPGGAVGLDINQPPSFECASQRDLVGVLELAADRQAAGGPGDPDSERLDQPGQVRRRRLAFQVGVGRENQLGNGAVGQPRHQFLDPQILGADPVNRADRAAEDMVAAAELADLLNRRDVLRLFHHADHRKITALAPADAALVLFGHIAAGAAEFHLLYHLKQYRREPANVRRVGRQQVKRDPLRSLRADARKQAELVDEALDDALAHLSARPRDRTAGRCPVRSGRAGRACRGTLAGRPRPRARRRSRPRTAPSSPAAAHRPRGSHRGPRRARGRPPSARSPPRWQGRWRQR